MQNVKCHDIAKKSQLSSRRSYYTIEIDGLKVRKFKQHHVCVGTPLPNTARPRYLLGWWNFTYIYVGYETTVYCVLISELMIKDFPIFQKFFHAHNNNNINCIAFKCLQKKVVCLRLIEDFRCVTQIQLLPLWHDTCGTWCGVSAWHSLLLSSTHNFLFSTTLLSFSLKKSQRNRVRITLYSPTKAFLYIVRTDEIILVWYLLKGLLALHWQCRNLKRNI